MCKAEKKRKETNEPNISRLAKRSRESREREKLAFPFFCGQFKGKSYIVAVRGKKVISV